MNKLLSNVPPIQFVSVGKNWTETFSKQSQWVLSCQRDCSTGIYGYKVNNVNSKSKISVFLLAFFLLYIIWIPISVSKLLYFSRIIPNQIQYLKILIYIDIDVYTEIASILSQAMVQNECTKREKTGKRALLINLRGFCRTWWKNRSRDERLISIKDNVDAKTFTWILCNIVDLLMVFTFKQKN